MELWKQAIDEAVRMRHDLHRRPELTWSEHETASFIREYLSQNGIDWRACCDTGTVATLNPQGSSRHVALRADIDALPIREESNVEWMSESEGCMHACGHDGHTAVLLAVARVLKASEQDLPGPVTLLFQPAEEGGHGAKRMIDEGALDGVDVIFGWHNWPAIPFGKAVCPDGAVMAANGTFSITVHGQGGHASQPEECRDPVLAAAAITMSLQQIVSRRLSPQRSAVVSVTSIDADSSETVIPSTTRLCGCIRLSHPTLRGEIEQLITEITEQIARGHGCTAEILMQPRYEATLNHPGAADEYRSVLQQELGGDAPLDESVLLPVMASEDFSYYLQAIPGAFALIGAGGPGGTKVPCHSPHYDFNDNLIPVVTRVLLRLVGLPVSDASNHWRDPVATTH